MIGKVKQWVMLLRGTKHLEVMTYVELEEAIYGSSEANFASLTPHETLDAMQSIKRR